MPAWLQHRSNCSPSKQAPTLAPTTSSCLFTRCHEKKQRLRLCAAASASEEALEALEQGGSSRREVRQMAPTALCLHVGVCIVLSIVPTFLRVNMECPASGETRLRGADVQDLRLFNNLLTQCESDCFCKTLPKAQQTRGLSSHHKLFHKYWSNSSSESWPSIKFKISTKHHHLHKT